MNASNTDPSPHSSTASQVASHRTGAMVVGILFLAAFVAYGGGNALVQVHLTSGALLMLANSAMVVGIGVIMLPILKRSDARVAYGYFGARIVEAALLAAGVVSLLSVEALGPLAARGNFLAYQSAMAVLGFSSLFFCYLLYRVRLVPRALALAGLIGYAVFFTGAVLEILGYPVGLILAFPGGLFELVFGVWLIAKGLNVAAPAAERAGATEEGVAA